MSLPYRQRHRLWRTRRTLRLSEPRLAAMMNMFARLNAGEAMPARERVRRRLPGPACALVHAVWAVLRWCARAVVSCARAVVSCARAVVSCARLLRPLGRPLRPCGRLLGRIALFALIRCSFLPAGFRLTVGCWLARREVASPRHGGARVTVLTPGPEELAVMGGNLMDHRHREEVFETSMATSAVAMRQDPSRNLGAA